jgi:hypothetical protein
VVEAQAAVALQRRVLAPRPVDQGDQLGQRVGAVEVPVAELVLLRRRVLLGLESGCGVARNCTAMRKYKKSSAAALLR